MSVAVQGLRTTMIAVLAGLVAGCAATTAPAPVFDRSPGAGTAPVAAAKSVSPTPGSKPAPPVTAAATADAAPVVAALPPTAPVEVQKLDEPPARPYREGDWRPEFHVVRKGDTLYSIALDYGQDYRELAAWNNLEDPGLIRIDQRLRLFAPESPEGPVVAQIAPPAPEAPVVAAAPVPLKTGPKGRKLPYSEQAMAELKMSRPGPAVAAPAPPPATPPAAKPPAPATPKAPVTTAIPRDTGADSKLVWEWPARGKVIYGFGQGSNQKGLGIEGRTGEAVLASAPGKVVYSGSGLRGYGKLIIIKHNASYLSVYAHNSQILVKEGQSVAKGQKIGEMGNSDSDKVALHFEIRRLGKPIDPMQHLPGGRS